MDDRPAVEKQMGVGEIETWLLKGFLPFGFVPFEVQDEILFDVPTICNHKLSRASSGGPTQERGALPSFILH